MAADALCTDSAHAAGRAGVYEALLNHNGNIVPTPEFGDADGPWALPDGTPFAPNVTDLANGRVRALLSQAADGSESANVAVWVGVSTENCQGWSSTSASDHGVSGTTARVGGALFYTGAPQCSSLESLMCFQVGAGGGPLVYPPLPVGAKIAFATELNVPMNFASPDSGVLDGGMASGDAVHATADAICNQVARGAGQPGKFHAFIVSSTKSESAYFSSHSMNGPWYRADGFEIASSLDALELNGSETEIAFGANGTFVSDVGDGVIAVGAVGANCSDFTSLVSAPVLVGFAAVPGTNAISFFDEDCSASPFGLYCFQE